MATNNKNMEIGLSKDEMDFVIELIDRRKESVKIQGGVISVEEIEKNKDIVEKYLDIYLFKAQLISATEIIVPEKEEL